MLRRLLFGSSFRIIITIAVVTVGGVALLRSLAPEPESREPPPQVPFAQTGRVSAGSGAIPVYGSGTVRPGAEIDIAPQVGGKVVWVDPGFQSGGRVRAGQTLFRIEEADYLYRLQEAEANLASRQVAFLQEQEQAAIARAQYELYADRRGPRAAPPEASPLTLREPQLEAARAALSRDEARLADAPGALRAARLHGGQRHRGQPVDVGHHRRRTHVVDRPRAGSMAHGPLLPHRSLDGLSRRHPGGGGGVDRRLNGLAGCDEIPPLGECRQPIDAIRRPSPYLRVHVSRVLLNACSPGRRAHGIGPARLPPFPRRTPGKLRPNGLLESTKP